MLHVDPCLADVAGCSTEQLESLARSIEDKKQRLEADINAYIRQKQHELHLFQQEVCDVCPCALAGQWLG
jgi:hypothetical protein